MKGLLYRNYQLRKNTLYLYTLLLLIAPIILLWLGTDSLLFAIVSAMISLISLIDSGHAFITYRKLGGQDTTSMYHSLPVSKLDVLNAHYLTTISLTLYGGLIIFLYSGPDRYNAIITVDDYKLDAALAYIIVNFIALILVFPSQGEVKKFNANYTLYVILMNIVLPISLVILMKWVMYEIPLLKGIDAILIWVILGITSLVLICTYLFQRIRLKKSGGLS